MYSQNNNPQKSMLEITIISAQGIKNTSPFSLLSPHLYPYITIKIFPHPPSSSCNNPNPIKGDNCRHVYTTRVDDEGGANPTWGDKFLLPVDPTTFLTTTRWSSVYLQLYTKRALLGLGRAKLGWVQIPVSDIFDGLSPIGSTHHLSYRVREKGGSRGHGVVNVAVRFVGKIPVTSCWRPPRRSSSQGNLAAVETWRTAIGIPVTTCR